MSVNIEEVIVTARRFPNALALPVAALIGTLEVETDLEEIHNDDLEITEHPVERGASIADHSYKKPTELVLRCGWSNSSLRALGTIAVGALRGGTMSREVFVSGSQTRSDYVGTVYSRLLEMQQTREPISVSSSLRHYDNMLIKSLSVSRDQKTSSVLMVTARFREVIIVSTQSASLPPREQQANPANTAEVENRGTLQLQRVTPGPGRSVPSNKW